MLCSASNKPKNIFYADEDEDEVRPPHTIHGIPWYPFSVHHRMTSERIEKRPFLLFSIFYFYKFFSFFPIFFCLFRFTFVIQRKYSVELNYLTLFQRANEYGHRFTVFFLFRLELSKDRRESGGERNMWGTTLAQEKSQNECWMGTGQEQMHEAQYRIEWRFCENGKKCFSYSWVCVCVCVNDERAAANKWWLRALSLDIVYVLSTRMFLTFIYLVQAEPPTTAIATTTTVCRDRDPISVIYTDDNGNNRNNNNIVY